MWSIDPANMLIHWIALTAMFLLMTYMFRERVTVEGFFGYFFLLLLIIPCNVMGGTLASVSQLSEAHPISFVATQIAANIIMLYIWCHFLHGLTSSGMTSLFLFGSLFGLLAFALNMSPPIPFEEWFPHANI